MVIFACLGASHHLAHRPCALEREFGSELSRPGIDHGGETYLDKGDGLIAMWNQADAFSCAAILRGLRLSECETFARLFGIFAGISPWW